MYSNVLQSRVCRCLEEVCFAQALRRTLRPALCLKIYGLKTLLDRGELPHFFKSVLQKCVKMLRRTLPTSEKWEKKEENSEQWCPGRSWGVTGAQDAQKVQKRCQN